MNDDDDCEDAVNYAHNSCSAIDALRARSIGCREEEDWKRYFTTTPITMYLSIYM